MLTSGADRNTSTNIASNVRQCVPKWAFKVRETCQVACGMISVWKQHSSNTEPESPCSSTFSLFYKKKQICITVHRELCPWSFLSNRFLVDILNNTNDKMSYLYTASACSLSDHHISESPAARNGRQGRSGFWSST